MNQLRRYGAVALMLVGLGSLTRAQTPVTFEKVLKLLGLEVKDEKILKLLAESPTQFTLDAEQLEKLKQAASEMKTMLLDGNNPLDKEAPADEAE